MRTIEAECVWCGCGLDRHDDDGSCVMLPANPTYSPALPRSATVPDEVVKALEDARHLLSGYARFILTVKADDLEVHPYQPSVEIAVSDIDAALQTIKGNGQ